MKKKTFISVIIPAYNEEKSLPKVLNDLPQEVSDIIVVDNASTDMTADKALLSGARVVYEPVRGYGQACLTGMANLSKETDVVVFIDADYSDHPNQLLRLVDPICEGEYDFVMGSRLLGNREKGAMTQQSFYGNKIACFLMKVFWNVQYSDLGPFRAISYKALQNMNMIDRDFGWTIEMQIKAIQNKLKIKEVPVDYRRRIGVSKISGTFQGAILAGYKILYTLFKYYVIK